MAAECRDTGIARLPAYALVDLAAAQLLHGEFLDAIATAEEGLRIAADTGQTHVTRELASTAAMLAAITGEEEACRARRPSCGNVCRGADPAPAGADCALAMLDLGCGRYQSALDWMRAATYGPARHNPEVLYAYPVHVEAAVRAGWTDLAARPLAQFTAWARAIGQRWATAVAARCAALTADDADAEPLWREAIAAHEGDGRPFEQAHTRLLYGEWLRRSRRRTGAREHLLAAAAAFARMGARPGRSAPRPSCARSAPGRRPVTADDPLARLTPQELQVVRLAAAGASNKQIGAQLFLSPRHRGLPPVPGLPQAGRHHTGRAGPAARHDLIRPPERPGGSGHRGRSGRPGPGPSVEGALSVCGGEPRWNPRYPTRETRMSSGPGRIAPRLESPAGRGELNNVSRMASRGAG